MRVSIIQTLVSITQFDAIKRADTLCLTTELCSWFSGLHSQINTDALTVDLILLSSLRHKNLSCVYNTKQNTVINFERKLSHSVFCISS